MTDGIPFAFDTYGTNKGGCAVGETYKDQATGYEYVFCQAFTDLTNDVLAVGQIVVQQSATQKGIVTNKASVGLDTTYPIGVGVAQSACPETTASITYYFWAMKRGYVATLLNDGTDCTATGGCLHTVAADPCTAKWLAGTATSDNGVLRTVFGVAAATYTGTNATAFINFKDI